MEGAENHEPHRFCIEVNTLQNAAEATKDLHCKTVCLNQLFSDVIKFSIVLSKKG